MTQEFLSGCNPSVSSDSDRDSDSDSDSQFLTLQSPL